MKKSVKLFIIALLAIPFILAFTSNEKTSINAMYQLNDQGELSIQNLELFKEALVHKFQSESKTINIDNIVAGDQTIEEGLVHRVFTVLSKDLDGDISISVSGVLNTTGEDPEIDYICSSFNCNGCDPFWNGNSYECSDCDPILPGIRWCIGYTPIKIL